LGDLTDLQAAGTTKIVGSDSTGLETTAVNASDNGELYTRDIINSNLINGAISVTDTPIEAKVGASALTNRKFITITPTTGVIYWGSSSSVTVSEGTPIFKNQVLTLSFSENVSVYLVAESTIDCRIVEGA
jgi:fibrillarin-like rRNA methylase